MTNELRHQYRRKFTEGFGSNRVTRICDRRLKPLLVRTSVEPL
jgi:hypothetical protein